MSGLHLAFAVFCTVPLCYPHSVPTHQQITTAAVQYLKQQDPRFSSLTDTQLQIGTVCEDAGAACSDSNHRFVFHFFPMLDTTIAHTTCRSVDWGFLSDLL